MPSNPYDAKGLLISSIEDEDPVVFFEPKRLYNGPFDGDPHRFRLGVEALRLGLAYEHDPYFSLSIARVDPLPHQPLPRADPRLLTEAARERPYGHGLLLRHVPELDRFVEAYQRPRPRPGGGRQLRLGQGSFDVLGLSAFPVRGDDEPPGESVRDPGPVIIRDDVQAQVQSGC